MKNFWENKNVLVTGCCGTVGSKLLEELVKFKAKKIVGIDNNESGIFEKRLKFKNKDILVGDVVDLADCMQYTKNIDIVFHTAAFKHVELCELSPRNAVRNNIQGTQNLISACIKNNVKKFIFTSSDKSVNPTNVMGSTKLLCERLVSSANNLSNETIFSSVRFGNILGSRGSVLTIFKKQIDESKPLTITDLDMTRYVMSLQKACNLLLKSAILSQGGEVFVLKMSAIKIFDLAKSFYKLKNGNLQNFKYKIVGKKNAEKKYEELITNEEKKKLINKKDILIINLDKKDNKKVCFIETNSHNDKHLSIDQIVKILRDVEVN